MRTILIQTTVAVLSRSLDDRVIGTGELSRENVTDAHGHYVNLNKIQGACPCHRSVAACELSMNCLAA